MKGFEYKYLQYKTKRKKQQTGRNSALDNNMGNCPNPRNAYQCRVFVEIRDSFGATASLTDALTFTLSLRRDAPPAV